MSRIVYVNGEYVPETEARVSIFDRGFLFADGVYEVTGVLEGRLIDFAGHAARLERSLGEIRMASPFAGDDLAGTFRELVRRNALSEGMIYLQITRGADKDRDFDCPAPELVPPTVIAFTQAKSIVDSPAAKKGIGVITIDDLRWTRRDIKTIQLLYPVLGKRMARDQGMDDAWMVEDGVVTEGTSNNACIVRDGRIITRDLSERILHGVTRRAVLAFARESRMNVEERPFTVDEAMKADEAFITSASTLVMPVVEIDGARIGDGTPGPVATRLRQIYVEESLNAAG